MIKQITERFTPRQYLAEFLLGLTALFGFYLIVAWSSYTPLDNSWATASAYGNTINKVGTFGAWIIDLFFCFFLAMSPILFLSPLFSCLFIY
ncbi:DNA translocase FtsK 4TM domain-containing protein [Haemophilus influenzae]|nr:DNA translocase FtsK 4TM domain-containing protein [Haemophilus influenzae]